MFVRLEDESANANLIVWPSVFEENRRAFLGATLLRFWERVQSATVGRGCQDRFRDISNSENGVPLRKDCPLSSTGAPILIDALGAVECRVVSIVERGDHHIVVVR
jgi:flavin reductase (DIM6/NTAB) family NADH-FMN oxidoreductase RutF